MSGTCPVGCVPLNSAAIAAADFNTRFIPGLSTGVVIGLAVGTAIFVFLLLLMFWLLFMRRKK